MPIASHHASPLALSAPLPPLLVGQRWIERDTQQEPDLTGCRSSSFSCNPAWWLCQVLTIAAFVWPAGRSPSCSEREGWRGKLAHHYDTAEQTAACSILVLELSSEQFVGFPLGTGRVFVQVGGFYRQVLDNLSTVHLPFFFFNSGLFYCCTYQSGCALELPSCSV